MERCTCSIAKAVLQMEACQQEQGTVVLQYTIAVSSSEVFARAQGSPIVRLEKRDIGSLKGRESVESCKT